jgi:hypothetical protein
MIPISDLQTQVLFEQLQRELDQARLRAGPTRHRQRRHLLGRHGTLFAALRTDGREAEQPARPAACDGGQTIAAGRGAWGTCLAANAGFGEC